MWFCCEKLRNESTSSSISVWSHLHQHFVAAGHEGPWFHSPTEPADALAAGVAAVDVHKVIPAQGVALQV